MGLFALSSPIINVTIVAVVVVKVVAIVLLFDDVLTMLL